jgi:hypothetical protein
LALLDILSHAFDRGQRSITPTDENALGHHEMQMGELISRSVKILGEVGKHAVNTVVGRMKLLMLVVRRQELDSVGGELCRLQPSASANVRKTKM